ncbi:MAG: hypothetical protein MJ252_13310 [archaeon]|nr:hypothetical protein [archaeon]
MHSKLKNFLLFSFIVFIFLLLIPSISTGCSDTNPNESYDCLKYSTNTSYCCYISLLEGDSKQCYEFADFTNYKGQRHFVHGSKRYEIDCGLGSTYMDSDWDSTIESRYFCGTDSPNDENDCFKGSTSDNSCCYYEGHGLKRCYNLGIKFEGTTKEDDYTVKCKGNTLIYSIINILLIIVYIG